jgi:hypothetical protein
MSDTYEFLGAFPGYALHGTLQAAFPASVPVIDPGIGLSVLLDGVDITIADEQTPFDAMGDNPLLAIVDDEIMAVYLWSLVSLASFQLFCLRGKYGTPIEAHAAGADCYIIQKNNLPILTHPQFRCNNTAEIEVGPTSAPSSLAPINTTIAGKIYTVPKPVNLRCNGVWFNPMFAANQNVTLSWSRPDPGGAVKGRLSALLTFFAADGVTELGATTVDNASEIALPYGTLLELLGGVAQTFVLQVAFQTCAEWLQLTSSQSTMKVLYV